MDNKKNPPILRIFDILLAGLGLVVLAPIFLIVIGAGYLETGSPIFRQSRVGRNKRPFTLVKFRTMRVDTPSLPSHLADPDSITRLGSILRRTKLDELPQLYNVLVGEMSLVGPRPCLPSQVELIEERDRLGVNAATPGVTGLSQLRGIDMSTPQELAACDREMLDQLNVRKYFKYILATAMGGGAGDRVRVPPP
jgi:O-antigen biosynthesis protein WbqP